MTSLQRGQDFPLCFLAALCLDHLTDDFLYERILLVVTHVRTDLNVYLARACFYSLLSPVISTVKYFPFLNLRLLILLPTVQSLSRTPRNQRHSYPNHQTSFSAWNSPIFQIKVIVSMIHLYAESHHAGGLQNLYHFVPFANQFILEAHPASQSATSSLTRANTLNSLGLNFRQLLYLLFLLYH